MNRRTALIAVLLVVTGFSGCLTGDGGTLETSATPTTTQSVEFPSKPAELTTGSVGEYVESYERAYRKQEIYDEYDADTTDVRNLAVNVQNVSTEKRGEHAFLVTLRYMAGYTTEEDGMTTAHDGTVHRPILHQYLDDDAGRHYRD